MRNKIGYKKIIAILLGIILVTACYYFVKQYSFTYFKYAKIWSARNDATLSLIIVGDISFDREVNKIIKKQNNPNYPFANVHAYLYSADFVFANLETTVSANCSKPSNLMSLCSDAKYLSLLSNNNIKVVSLANNHVSDLDQAGLVATINNLQQQSIRFVGANNNLPTALQPEYLSANGITVAIIAFVDPDLVVPDAIATANKPGVAPMDIRLMQQAVQAAKQHADFVIVSMHAGDEYQTSVRKRQIEFAHAAIDAGAAIVIGHHPHVIQPAEKYHGHYIFYSLGNFVFDQIRSDELRTALTLKIVFTKKKLACIELNPAYDYQMAQPSLIAGTKADIAISRLQLENIITKPIYYWDNATKKMQTNVHFVIQNEPCRFGFKQQNQIVNNQSQVRLKYGLLSLTQNGHVIWRSKANWWVDAFQIAVLSNAERTDLIFSLWKSGNYFKEPFWHAQNERKIRNHLFIYRINSTRLQPVWGSSNLSAPICKFSVSEVKELGANNLVVLEGDYCDYPNCIGKHLALWSWNGWGFENDWRSDPGLFYDFSIRNLAINDKFKSVIFVN